MLHFGSVLPEPRKERAGDAAVDDPVDERRDNRSFVRVKPDAVGNERESGLNPSIPRLPPVTLRSVQ